MTRRNINFLSIKLDLLFPKYRYQLYACQYESELVKIIS